MKILLVINRFKKYDTRVNHKWERWWKNNEKNDKQSNEIQPH